MVQNLLYSLNAIALEIFLIGYDLISQPMFIGFLWGMFLTLLASAFVLTRNKQCVSSCLNNSDIFQKLTARHRHADGTYRVAYSEYLRLHRKTKIIIFIGLAFFLVVLTRFLLVY